MIGDGGAPPEFDTCLGDLFSVAWMEDAEASDRATETLGKQFKRVRARTAPQTSDDGGFAQGSHVQRFGEIEAASAELVRDYLGPQGGDGGGGSGGGAKEERSGRRAAGGGRMPQRDADLAPLLAAARRGGPAGAAALRSLRSALRARDALDGRLRAAVDRLLRQPRAAAALLALLTVQGPAAAAAASAASDFWAAQGVLEGAAPAAPQAAPLSPLASALMAADLRPPGAPLVSEQGGWDCLRSMVDAWESACGPLGIDGARHTRLFANLCNAGIAAADVAAAAPCAPAPA